ncbi:TetR family transcriptional regulator C-terminal domain-containing protein [Acidisoma cellulosilytica]|uniref:TetR family transcriptional regulator C-terminal domain-containing protein n=1 Tax=Acidisoma cellulosilyticum TaxID=2802395 RepID=A0A964E2J2_9PROT|nr:TetR family transcriptional regulator C-terminal domain-containing protein [Acidisoma cellulosilyticum]MCB8879675.1 TetR family transcriptional regulator C-terminal domain-containing protein [Acidisoma cellulosilyticum]
MPKAPPKYRRETAAVRREHLVTATLHCLAEYGVEGASVRRIAAAAQISVGLINHHYKRLDDLVAEAYRFLAADILRQIMTEVAQAGPDPRHRLQAFFETSFSPTVLDPRLLSAWIVFWSMIQHSATMRSVQAETNGEYRLALEAMLTDFAAAHPRRAPVDIRLAGVALSSLLDGLWIAWGLNPGAFEPRDGIAICEAWLDERWP